MAKYQPISSWHACHFSYQSYYELRVILSYRRMFNILVIKHYLSFDSFPFQNKCLQANIYVDLVSTQINISRGIAFGKLI